MKRVLQTILLALLVAGSWIATAAASEEADRAEGIAFYERKVRPLLVERCYGCHSAEAEELKSRLRLDGRRGILAGGRRGPAIVPGEPEKSLLVQAVRYESEELRMPPTGKLGERDIAALFEWIAMGAPMPDDAAEDAAGGGERGLAPLREFWSFRPLERHEPPAAGRADWVRRRIDAFVLGAMEQQGLSPSAEADRRTLIRRATFDLVGLPPTPQEVEAFLVDNQPDSYERLLERLLASPHYGERWGRFWLDLARYSDSTAVWLKSVGQAYLYRDWVVRAFNEDMPYNEFVKRQLATDMIPETGPEDSPALGFLGLSPTYWKELKLDKDVIKTVVAEEWEERIDAVGRTFLGLTLACARCHDHKFDPITMEDYYALAGVFASTRLADLPLLPEEEATPVRQAHELVASLKKKVEGLRTAKPVPEEAERQAKELEGLVEHIEQSTPHYDAPMAHGVEDAALYVLADGPNRTKLVYEPGVAQDVAMHLRGNPGKLGEVVPRRFLAVFSHGEPKPFERGSGRLELAEALVDDAAPLAARVIVNRIWKQHFGRGLVTTPSNFGAQGAAPSHPELLDDLAARFVENGWSIKWLHREIMLSATYRQSSEHDDEKHSIDPDNRWLWRMNRRRLDIEQFRDAVLAVAGKLELDVGGPPMDLSDANNHRRTLYGQINRRDVHQMLRLYDFPNPTSHSPAREMTTTPLQQLFVLNSPFLEEQAAALVRRVRSDSETGADVDVLIQRAYQLLFCRKATAEEVRLGKEFLTVEQGGQVDDEAWRQYAQVLLGSNEFVFVD